MEYPVSTIERAMIGCHHSVSGADLYALLWNTRGQVWNQSWLAWQSYDVLERPYYAVALAEQGASRFYAKDLGGGFERIFYGEFLPTLSSFCHTRHINVEVFERGGATVAESDSHLLHLAMCLEWVPAGADPARCAIARPRSIRREGVFFAAGSIGIASFDNTVPDLGLIDNAIQFFRTARRL